ncbi:hypothetical protein KM043_003690 [Ampulex compressa]|nr:hypothetical protein KM043_003690 [Ampulex compressa]
MSGSEVCKIRGKRGSVGPKVRGAKTSKRDEDEESRTNVKRSLWKWMARQPRIKHIKYSPRGRREFRTGNTSKFHPRERKNRFSELLRAEWRNFGEVGSPA